MGAPSLLQSEPTVAMSNNVLLALSLLGLLAAANAGVTWDFYRRMAAGPLPEVVRQEGESDLLMAVRKAELVKALEDPSPKTLFGPTNDAFKLLSPELLKYLETNTTFLKYVLEYHVLPAKVMSTDLKNELIAKAIDGKPVRVNIYKDGKVITIAGKPVVKADVAASNGVLHELGGVMMPADYTVTEAVTKDSALSTLATAVTAAGLAATLSGPGPFTLFAPNNEAFKKLPAGTLDKLLANKTALTNVLTYHVVPGTFFSPGLENGAVKTVNGATVNVAVSADGVMVNNAKVVLANVNLVNGCGHEIDTVLLPPGFSLENMMDHPHIRPFH